MADEADLAKDLEEFALKQALAHRKGGGVNLAPRGLCYNCDEPLKEKKPFCDEACRDDWEKQQAAKRRNVF